MTITGEQSAALIYARQSQDSQTSKDEQENAGRARAEQEGWPVRGVYRDGTSASRHANGKRKEWPKLLADLDHPDVGVLWLWESSRGDRELESWAGLLNRCREHGVRIYVETHGRLYDMSVARDWRTLAEDGVDSAYESDKVSVRVKRSMAALAAKGMPHGKTPYGYTRKYTLTATGKRELVGQVINPAQAKIVRRIYKDLARRVSLRSLAAELNAKGIPSPSGKEWSPGIVRELALKACYAGKRSHSPANRQAGRRHDLGELIDATWPAIVKLEQWHEVRKLLLDPKRRTSRPGRAKHLLSLIATCDVCGDWLSIRYPKDRQHGGSEGEYFCRSRNCVRAPQDELDEYVTALIVERLADPSEYERLTVDDTADDRLGVARDELAELTAHHAEMVALMASRKMSAGAFADAEPQVLADIKRAEEQVNELESPTSLRHLLGDPGRDLAKRWADMPPAARRQVVRLLFDHVTLSRSPSRGHRMPIEQRVKAAFRKPAKQRTKSGRAKRKAA